MELRNPNAMASLHSVLKYCNVFCIVSIPFYFSRMFAVCMAFSVGRGNEKKITVLKLSVSHNAIKFRMVNFWLPKFEFLRLNQPKCEN